MSGKSAGMHFEGPDPGIEELEILWVTAGLSCDGDSIAMTAATQPSIEDILLGALPGIPKVTLHHPVFSKDSGDEFMEKFHRAAEGRLGPFILSSKVRSPTRRTRPKAIGPASAPTRAPANPF